MKRLAVLAALLALLPAAAGAVLPHERLADPALEARARALGKLIEPEISWRARNAALLDAQGAPWTMRRGGPRAKRNGAKRRGAKRGGAKRGGAKHSGTERGIKS
jgi:hypothetical protein